MSDIVLKLHWTTIGKSDGKKGKEWDATYTKKELDEIKFNEDFMSKLLSTGEATLDEKFIRYNAKVIS